MTWYNNPDCVNWSVCKNKITTNCSHCVEYRKRGDRYMETSAPEYDIEAQKIATDYDDKNVVYVYREDCINFAVCSHHSILDCYRCHDYSKGQAPVLEVAEKATRYNSGKPRLGLIPPQISEGLGYVMSFGAEKYGDDNWKKGLTDECCLSSCERHIMYFKKGERYDKESGVSHLAHAAANLAFMLYFHEQAGFPVKEGE